jgi:hypothetical protein
LRLRSFSSTLPKAVDMLAVLQPHSLTSVTLDLDEAATDSSALCAALLQLSSLQRLHIEGIFYAGLGSALTALAQLSQLTLLHISDYGWDEEGLLEPAAVALQRLLVQQLPLQELQLDTYGKLPVLDMSQLTQLTELDVFGCDLSAESLLPAQLQRLSFDTSSGGCTSLTPVTRAQLQQLQHLTLGVGFKEPQLLLQLAQLPALQQLDLSYGSSKEIIAATAPAWPFLPQLQFLRIGARWSSKDPEFAAILAGITAATSLTRLELDVSAEKVGPFGPFDPFGPYARSRPLLLQAEVAVCSRLTCLTRLRELSISRLHASTCSALAPSDAQSLTALSSLTYLDLCGAAHGVGTAAASALANTLTQLQRLNLSGCELQLGTAEGMACLKAIGRLTQLTYLDISCNMCDVQPFTVNPGLTQQGLMQLTGLSRLQELQVTREAWQYGGAVTDEVLQDFWAALWRQ